MGKKHCPWHRPEDSFRLAANLACSYRSHRRFDAAMLDWKGDLAAARRVLAEKPNPGEFWYEVGCLICHLPGRQDEVPGNLRLDRREAAWTGCGTRRTGS